MPSVVRHHHALVANEQNPTLPRPLKGLAWILSTHPQDELRDPKQAIEFATQAMKLTGGNDPEVFDIMAAAHAADGNFAQAIAVGEQGLKRLPASHPLAVQLGLRLQGYRENKAFVETGVDQQLAPQ